MSEKNHKSLSGYPAIAYTGVASVFYPYTPSLPLEEEKTILPEIMEILENLTDEQWKTLTKSIPYTVTKEEFAKVCTGIAEAVSKSTFNKLLPGLVRILGLDAIDAGASQMTKIYGPGSSSVTCLEGDDEAEADVSTRGSRKSTKSGTPTPRSSSHSSLKRSVDAPGLVCEIVEDVVRDVSVAMSVAIQRFASGQASPVSIKGRQSSSPNVNEEILQILSARLKIFFSGQTAVEGQADKQVEPDTAALTGQVLIAALDAIESCNAEGAHAPLKSDVLSAVVEKIKLLASPTSSEESFPYSSSSSSNLKQSIHQLTSNEFQAKALQAVNQALFLRCSESSTRKSGGPSESPGSVVMVEKIAMIESSFDSTASDIVATVVESLHSLSHSIQSQTLHGDTKTDRFGPNIFSTAFSMFHSVQNKLKKLLTLSQRPVSKDRSTETLQMGMLPKQADSMDMAPGSITDLPHSKSVSQLANHLTLTCTNEIIGQLLHTYHSDVSELECSISVGGGGSEVSLAASSFVDRVMFQLDELTNVSRSTSCESFPAALRDLTRHSPDLDAQKGAITNGATVSTCGLPPQGIQKLCSVEFQSEAKRVVSDVLLRSGKSLVASVTGESIRSPSSNASTLDTRAMLEDIAMTETSSVSTSLVHVVSTASDIVGLVAESLQNLSQAVQSSDSAEDKKSVLLESPLISSTSQTLGSDTQLGKTDSDKNILSIALGIYLSVQNKVKDFSVHWQSLSKGKDSSNFMNKKSTNQAESEVVPPFTKASPQPTKSNLHLTDAGLIGAVPLQRGLSESSQPAVVVSECQAGQINFGSCSREVISKVLLLSVEEVIKDEFSALASKDSLKASPFVDRILFQLEDFPIPSDSSSSKSLPISVSCEHNAPFDPKKSNVSSRTSVSSLNLPIEKIQKLSSEEFQSKATRVVSEVLLKKVKRLSTSTSSQSSRNDPSQTDTDNSISSSTSSQYVECAAAHIASTVVDALQRFLSSQRESCQPLTNIQSYSDEQLVSDLKAPSDISGTEEKTVPASVTIFKIVQNKMKAFFTMQVKDMELYKAKDSPLLVEAVDTTPTLRHPPSSHSKGSRSGLEFENAPGALPGSPIPTEMPVDSNFPVIRSTIIDTGDSCTIEHREQPTPCPDICSTTRRLENLISGGTIHNFSCNLADQLQCLMIETNTNHPIPSMSAGRSISDSVHPKLRGKDKETMEDVYIFVEESVKRILQHILFPPSPKGSNKSEINTSGVLIQDIPSTSSCTVIAIHLNQSSSEPPTSSSQALKDGTEYVTSLAEAQQIDSDKKSRTLTSRTASSSFGSSRSSSSMATSDIVHGVFADLNVTSSAEELIRRSSSDILNADSSLAPPSMVETVKKERNMRFNFVRRIKLPKIRISKKHSTKKGKVNLLLQTPESQPSNTTANCFQTISSSESLTSTPLAIDHLSSSPSEEKPCKLSLFSRLFSAISKVLPNPFKK